MVRNDVRGRPLTWLPGAKNWWCMISVVVVCCVTQVTAKPLQYAISGCASEADCSQCPRDRYTISANKTLLCCAGCASALLYHGSDPSPWCVCYTDNISPSSKTIKFPGDSNPGFQIPGSSSGGFFGGVRNPDPQITLQDALFILNRGDGMGLDRSSMQAVQEALTLMANTIEDLHARISRLEDLVLRGPPPDLHPSGSIDRLGSVSAPGSSSSSSSSSSSALDASSHKNFTRIGDKYYHISIWKNRRSIWEDARTACERIGSKLAEPLTHKEFLHLTQYLSLTASTTGYSYWIGGVYPGVLWFWIDSGRNVTKDMFYWADKDSKGNRISPGDTGSGRCLSLAYFGTDYYYTAGECGYEKNYVCELLEASHRKRSWW